jgi:hypothetical protein
MAKGQLTKERQDHDQRETDKRQTISWSKFDIVSFVTLPLTMVLSVFCHFTFGHDIVCLLSVSLWP